jgi:hypothetical protein
MGCKTRKSLIYNKKIYPDQRTKVIPRRFSRTAANFRQADFSSAQWCCSARDKVVATVSAVSSPHNLASHRMRSRSNPYLSAAANKCCTTAVAVHIETDPANSWMSGSSSAYMKFTIDCTRRKIVTLQKGSEID